VPRVSSAGESSTTYLTRAGAACAALIILDSPDLNEMGRPIVQHRKLALGNLVIARDWGYAGDFVRAMWLILQWVHPDDFVSGTGRLHTLKELCETTYRCLNGTGATAW
jgi:GDPmannose 4,6-dehydratase